MLLRGLFICLLSLSTVACAERDELLLELEFNAGKSTSLSNNSDGQQYQLEHVFTKARFKPPTDPYWREECPVGNCVKFDGYSNFVEIADFDASSLENGFQISVWLAPHAFEWGDGQQYSGVVSQFDPQAKAGFIFGVYRHGQWGLKVGDGLRVVEALVDERLLPRDKWSLVVAQYDPAAGSLNLYLDGRPLKTKIDENGIGFLPADLPLRIGKHSVPVRLDGIFHLNMYNGLIDELSIGAGLSSAAEINTAYEAVLAENGGALPEISWASADLPRSTLDGDHHRPQYHLTPTAHWMNEPHAPLYFNGRYHLFFQKNPHGPFWHQIHWGHWISEDLAHWQELPIALYPEQGDLTPDAVWSGSAALDANGEPALFFTAGNDSAASRQRTGLARPTDISDPMLTKWTMHPAPVTLQQRGQGDFGNFRDPFVFKDGSKDRWYQLVTSGIPGGSGTALVFDSDNLVDWTYRGPLFSTNINKYPEVGTVWELPVLLPIGTGVDGRPRHVFMLSPVGEGSVREVWYWIGVWESADYRFVPDHEEPRKFDFGRDHFTGPSGFVDPKTGRAIVFSIAQGEATPQQEQLSGWAHNAGLPVEMWLGDDDRLRLAPIEELQLLRSETLIELRDVDLATARSALANATGDSLEIEIVAELPAKSDESLTLTFRKAPDGSEQTQLRYRPGDERFEIDRTRTTLNPDMRTHGVQGGTASGAGNEVRLRVYLDRSMVEAYLNDLKTLTSRVYPSQLDATGLDIDAPDGARFESLTVWRMGSAFGDLVPAAPSAVPFKADTWASDIPNHDFSECKLGRFWTVKSGNAFSDAAITSATHFANNVAFNPSQRIPGGCHLWGAEVADGDAATGVMESNAFVLGGDGWINFLIAGKDNVDEIYLALVAEASGEEIHRATGSNHDKHRRVYWDASDHLGKRLFFRAVDGDSTVGGHLSFDDINARFAATAGQ